MPEPIVILEQLPYWRKMRVRKLLKEYADDEHEGIIGIIDEVAEAEEPSDALLADLIDALGLVPATEVNHSDHPLREAAHA